MAQKIDICPECKSHFFYTRTKTMQRVCRRCGHIWEIGKQDGRRKNKKN